MSLPLDLRRKVRIHHDHTETDWGVHEPVEEMEWNADTRRYARVQEYRSKIGARGVGYTVWVKWVCMDTDCKFEAWVSNRAIDHIVGDWLAEAGEHRTA